MPQKKILILGAGLAGLSAAWHLQKLGVEAHLIEKEPEVGGLCRTKYVKGFTFDCDGHLLHFKHRYTFNLVKGLIEGKLVKHQRSAWVYVYDRFIRYPFQGNLHNLPAPIIRDCLVGLLDNSHNGQLKKKNPTFLDWINHSFGKGIARHFMIPYNTKFWTLPPEKLNYDWVDGFVPVPSLGQIIDGSIEENRKMFGYNAQFWYPEKGGINQVPLAFAGRIKNIYTNCKVTGIDIAEKKVCLDTGEKEKFDYLISTIPLPQLRGLIKNLPQKVSNAFGDLRWNSIFNLNLGVEGNILPGVHWVYFPEKEFCYFRVGFPHNFSSGVTPAGRSALYIEVSYSENKRINKVNIVHRIKEGLKKAGIFTPESKICAEDINNIKYGYPIYDKNYRFSRKAILGFLSENGIVPCGRFGSWRYMSMEDCILDGKDAIKQLK